MDNRSFLCLYDECTKSYATTSHLKRHMASVHENQDAKAIRCPFENCDQLLSSEHTLYKHTKVHKKRSYKCSHCQKTFLKNQHLKIHEYEHTGVYPFVCSYENCRKAYLMPSRLKRHLKCHQGYKCDHEGCESLFSKWSELRTHKKEKHPQIFECTVCHRKFYSTSNLRMHEAIHSKQRDAFHCPVDGCPRHYYHERNLRHHVKSYHEKKHFVCCHDDCGKVFALKASLKRHLRAHNPDSLVPPRKRACQPGRRQGQGRCSTAAWLSGYPASRKDGARLATLLGGASAGIDSPAEAERVTSLSSPASALSCSHETGRMLHVGCG